MATTYRTCPRTGLQFDLDADKLMRWNAVAGVLWLLVGGITALLVILTRWPAIKLLPADQFYLILTAHGIDMLILWILFFEMAVLYFASSTLLRCRLATPKIAWLGFWLMVVGGIMTNVAIFQGESSVMFTSYVPMQAAPHFYLGIILVAVGTRPEAVKLAPVVHALRAAPWAETRVLNGEVGDYVTMARKDRNSEQWFLGSLTDEHGRVLSVPLSFLTPGKTYLAEIYRDGDDAHYVENRFAFAVESHDVTSADTLKMKLAPGGGQAIRLVPVD